MSVFLSLVTFVVLFFAVLGFVGFVAAVRDEYRRQKRLRSADARLVSELSLF